MSLFNVWISYLVVYVQVGKTDVQVCKRGGKIQHASLLLDPSPPTSSLSLSSPLAIECPHSSCCPFLSGARGWSPLPWPVHIAASHCFGNFITLTSRTLLPPVSSAHFTQQNLNSASDASITSVPLLQCPTFTQGTSSEAFQGKQNYILQQVKRTGFTPSFMLFCE